MSNLTQHPEATFWYWICERHEIFLRRQRGEPKPWTTDPIFQNYKFTNPFRENDRGTVWLREHFLTPHRSVAHDILNLELLAFNIGWYRMFNWWGTGEALGWQTNWNPGAVRKRLEERLGEKKQVFTGAHIVYSRPGLPKIDAIVQVCTDLWNLRGSVSKTAREQRSLQAVFNVLTTVDSVGGFMAYEMVTDMRHTHLLGDATDILTWANPGPGAQRGLQRLGMPHTTRNANASMEELLGRAQASLPADFPKLEMRDIEHSLCEFDKYCRVVSGEGEPRAKFNGRA
jgi:hypothetical protein